MKEMVNVKRTGSISMQAEMSRIQDIYRKVSKGEITFTDKQIAMIFLSKYEGLIRSMEQEVNLTTKAVKASLVVEGK
jgi:dissimilatory sulfite reductase (desulfoviridin) alpha/beta subunit